jgi:hypothetical protein
MKNLWDWLQVIGYVCGIVSGIIIIIKKIKSLGKDDK